MAGLLGGVLPAIYSGADQLKRQVYGLLTNPMEMAERAGQNLLQSHNERQALMRQAHGDPTNPLKITDKDAFNALTSQVMAGELGFAPMGITAWHGSPHTFNKFDISKVGTGEGNQSFGYGMYFAEQPAVAKQYQASLSDTKYFSGGQQLKGNDAWAAQFLHDFQGDALPKKVDVKTAVAKANEILKSGEARDEIVNKIKQLDKAGVSVESGNLYKVDIPDADIPKMLDWDKPLSQQPKDVQDALAKYDPDMYSPKGNDYDSAELGQHIYQRIIQNNVKKFGHGGNQQRASQDLNALGIKGIRYYDEGSRKAGGTSNFVVFDPTDVKILERNNQPVESLLGN